MFLIFVILTGLNMKQVFYTCTCTLFMYGLLYIEYIKLFEYAVLFEFTTMYNNVDLLNKL